MTLTGIDAMNQFLHHRSAGDRLIIRRGELCLVHKSKISLVSCIKAWFGSGNASMRKITDYIDANRDNLFFQEDGAQAIQDKKAFNNFIRGYNRNHILTRKKCCLVGDIEGERITFFGEDEWARIGIDIKDVPPLPPKFNKLCKSPCPIWPDKTIEETHMLVLIPKKFGEKDVTVNRIQKLAWKYLTLEGHELSNRRILKEQDGHYDYDQSYWLLITKDVIPGSVGQEYSNDFLPEDYHAPRLIEADIALLAQYLRGRKLTDKSTFMFHENMIWCQETNNPRHYAVGFCDRHGYKLYTPLDIRYTGMAVVKRL